MYLDLMDGRHVLAAMRTCQELLEPEVGADWNVPVPGLDFTVASVVAHAGESPLWYAVDLQGGPNDDGAFELKIRTEVANSRVLASLLSAARLCAASIDSMAPSARGFHPFGSADPSGFAAMACDELLVHGDDAARGLGVAFAPDRSLAAAVLDRLFPWHQVGTDPWRTLLWANGRVALPGRPAQFEWRWHSAPLDEWDGRQP
jgi:uncharacterized protein (TIGR03083 family)